MASYFFDTSALVKRYHREPGSPAVATLFAEPNGAFCISRLALVETVSAFSLKVRVARADPRIQSAAAGSLKRRSSPER